MRPGPEERGITVVSGLPRSGTSLMMQMLEAAGLAIASDGRRIADEDNPRGYYELEAVKRLREDATFVAGLAGRAVKVVAPLLPALPPGPAYRVVFLERDLEEVLASQARMLARRGGGPAGGAAPDEAALARAFEASLARVRAWLAARPETATLFVAHRRLLAEPAETALEVVRFLRTSGAFAAEPLDDAELARRARAMATVVDPSLHRARRR